MNDQLHPPLGFRDIRPLIGLAVVAAVAAGVLLSPAASLPFWLAALLLLQFSGDVERAVPQDPNAVLSPADGRIVVVERARDPYADRDALRIGVFINMFNMRANRVPVDGAIEQVRCADQEGAEQGNRVREALTIAAANGETVTCVHTAGGLARRLLGHLKVGGKLKRGQRYGFARFGTRIDVYLPLTARPRVSLGDKVSATETILAEI